MKLYINIFKDINIPHSFLSEESESNNFIDFQNEENELLKGIKKIAVEDFENFDLSYNNAVKNYTSFVANLSTKNIAKHHIRLYALNNLPLFWLTSISEKHYYHWLMKVMLLKELLANNTPFFAQYNQIIILLPSNYKKARITIEQLFSPYQILCKWEYIPAKPTANPYFTLIKIAVQTIVQFLKMETPKTTSLYKFAFVIRGNITNYTKKFFNNIVDITDTEKKDVALVPLYYWKNDKFNLNYNVSELFWDSKPNIYKLCSVYFQQFKLLYNLKKINPNQEIKINNVSISAALLNMELQSVIIKKNSSLIMGCWLNRYKKNESKRIKLFYENEFYFGGRVISYSLKGLNTFGVQHSLIVKNHTVYHISDIERNSSQKNKVDGLPLPQQFITWGNIFKTQFLSHNSFSNNFIYVAGNTTYIKKYTEQIQVKNIKPDFNVLYCLTTPAFFNKEKNIIKNTLANIPNLKLEIRFHPLWPFNKNLLINFFNNINVTFNNETDILDSINNANLIITSAHSGVWLDALIMKKPVIRLITSFYDNFEQENVLFNVGNSVQMEKSIKHILKRENNFSENNNLLYLEADRWKKLLTNKPI